MTSIVSPSWTASPAFTFKEKMEPGKGAGMAVPPPEGAGVANAGTGGAAAAAVLPAQGEGGELLDEGLGEAVDVLGEELLEFIRAGVGATIW